MLEEGGVAREEIEGERVEERKKDGEGLGDGGEGLLDFRIKLLHGVHQSGHDLRARQPLPTLSFCNILRATQRWPSTSLKGCAAADVEALDAESSEWGGGRTR